MSRAADLAAGLYGGVPAPYGWTNSGRRIIRNPREWPVVETIIHLYEEEGLTMREIATVLNRSKKRSRNGGLWNKDKVQNVLSSIHVHKGVGYTMGKHRKPTMVIAINNKGENHEQVHVRPDTQVIDEQPAAGDGHGRGDREEAGGEQGVRDPGPADGGDPVVRGDQAGEADRADGDSGGSDGAED